MTAAWATPRAKSGRGRLRRDRGTTPRSRRVQAASGMELTERSSWTQGDRRPCSSSRPAPPVTARTAGFRLINGAQPCHVYWQVGSSARSCEHEVRRHDPGADLGRPCRPGRPWRVGPGQNGAVTPTPRHHAPACAAAATGGTTGGTTAPRPAARPAHDGHHGRTESQRRGTRRRTTDGAGPPRRAGSPTAAGTTGGGTRPAGARRPAARHDDVPTWRRKRSSGSGGGSGGVAAAAGAEGPPHRGSAGRPDREPGSGRRRSVRRQAASRSRCSCSGSSRACGSAARARGGRRGASRPRRPRARRPDDAGVPAHPSMRSAPRGAARSPAGRDGEVPAVPADAGCNRLGPGRARRVWRSSSATSTPDRPGRCSTASRKLRAGHDRRHDGRRQRVRFVSTSGDYLNERFPAQRVYNAPRAGR